MEFSQLKNVPVHIVPRSGTQNVIQKIKKSSEIESALRGSPLLQGFPAPYFGAHYVKKLRSLSRKFRKAFLASHSGRLFRILDTYEGLWNVFFVYGRRFGQPPDHLAASLFRDREGIFGNAFGIGFLQTDVSEPEFAEHISFLVGKNFIALIAVAPAEDVSTLKLVQKGGCAFDGHDRYRLL